MLVLAACGLHTLVLLWTLLSVTALPLLNGMYGRSSMAGVIVGATAIEAIAARPPDGVPGQIRHLTTKEQGEAGNLTVLPNDRMPPVYYLKKDRLWLYVNDTSILPVNILNVTESSLKHHHPPFQLVAGKQVEGVVNGVWSYAGSMLYYDFPGKSETQGLFFKCNPSSALLTLFYQTRNSGGL